MKSTIRIASLAIALLFGAATVLPLTATDADAATKKAAHHMHKGSAGSASVKSAQEALNKEGANLTVDGKSGPKTRAAIKSYQQAHGLKATGKLDKATKAALNIS